MLNYSSDPDTTEIPIFIFAGVLTDPYINKQLNREATDVWKSKGANVPM